jgi:hypothetical protein
VCIVSDTFKVGEIAIIQNAALAYLNEMECEVIAVYSPPLRWGRLEAHYSIRAANGEVYAAARYHLRKKRPPQQHSGELRIRELFDQSPVEQLVPAEIA